MTSQLGPLLTASFGSDLQALADSLDVYLAGIAPVADHLHNTRANQARPYKHVARTPKAGIPFVT